MLNNAKTLCTNRGRWMGGALRNPSYRADCTVPARARTWLDLTLSEYYEKDSSGIMFIDHDMPELNKANIMTGPANSGAGAKGN